MIAGLPSLAGTQRYLVYGYAVLLSTWLVAEPVDWSTDGERHPVRLLDELLSSMSGTAAFAATTALALTIGSIVSALVPPDLIADAYLRRAPSDRWKFNMESMVGVRSSLMAQGLATPYDGGAYIAPQIEGAELHADIQEVRTRFAVAVAASMVALSALARVLVHEDECEWLQWGVLPSAAIAVLAAIDGGLKTKVLAGRVLPLWVALETKRNT